MKMKTIVRVTLCTMLGMAASIAAGQSPPNSLPQPPPGFKVLEDGPSAAAMKAAGIQDGVRSEKPNSNWPNCTSDPKILFNYGWTTQPGADKFVEMVAQGPEEPATEAGMIRTEPAGKRRHKGGVLVWRKTMTPVVGTIGECREDPMVTHDGSWVGMASGKLIGVSVNRLYGSRETGQAWIDEYIGKMIAAVTGPK
jgi:hypothetical protein